MGILDDARRPAPDRPARADGSDAWLGSYDVCRRTLGLPDGAQVHLLYVQTLVDPHRLWREVVQPLVSGALTLPTLPGASAIDTPTALAHRLLGGSVALWTGDGRHRLAVDVQENVGRNVGEASTETAIVGPKAGFVERLDTNVALIRRLLPDPALRVDRRVVGRRSRTRVAVLHIADVANRAVVDRALQGLAAIAIDQVRTTADIASQLYAGTWTPFPLVEQTERPDKAAAALAEGRLVMVVEGSPFALVVPVNLALFLEDSETAVLGSAPVVFARLLRALGLAAATGAAGLYVAATTVSVNILPIRLAVNVSASRFGVPFPPLTEALLALVIADILVEATSQASKNVGNALTIVGTLIIGQMMVQARLSSNLMMVVVAATVLGTFLTVSPAMSYALRIWKYVLVLFGGLGGIGGWTAGWLLLIAHLAGLESAGVPYLSPFGPMRPGEIWRYGIHPLPPMSRRLRPFSWRPRRRVRSATEARG